MAGSNGSARGNSAAARIAAASDVGDPRERRAATSHHIARRDAWTFAIAFDRGGKLHFSKADIGGDHVVVLLGPVVSDAHLAELAGDGVSYVVAPDAAMDPRALFELLGRELGIKRLLVEGANETLAHGVVRLRYAVEPQIP